MIDLTFYIAIGCWIATVTVKPQGTVAGCVVRTLAAIWLWPVVMLKAAEWPFACVWERLASFPLSCVSRCLKAFKNGQGIFWEASPIGVY